MAHNKDPEKYREYMKEYMLKRYHERREKAIEKLGGKCSKCRSTDGLQFDHVDRTTKKFTIGTLSSINEQDFWKEVDKCQLLCDTCHQAKTLVDLGRVSAKGTHGTLSSYRYCKCDECKAVKAAYMKSYKRKDR
jgi:5-methylcytosine-specific restriction endonuclease McrA